MFDLINQLIVCFSDTNPTQAEIRLLEEEQKGKFDPCDDLITSDGYDPVKQFILKIIDFSPVIPLYAQ